VANAAGMAGQRLHEAVRETDRVGRTAERCRRARRDRLRRRRLPSAKEALSRSPAR
jgi:hypothetical protein